VIEPGGEKPHAGNGTPMLGNQTQFPTNTGLEQLRPQAAGARLTFAHESAYATPVRASIAMTAIAARIALLIDLPFIG